MVYTVGGISQARILKWVAFPFSRGSNPGLPHCRQILYQLSHKAVGDGQGSLACCSPWGHKESDTTEQLNWTENPLTYLGLWIALSSINDYITSCTGDMQTISSLSYANLSNVHIFHYTVSKNYIINNSINLIINLSFGQLSNSVTGTSSPSFFSWKLNSITDSLLWSDMLASFIPENAHHTVAVQSFDSATPQTVACQVPLSMGFSRQEYRSGLPLAFPGNLPNPGIKPASSAWQVDSLPLSHPRNYTHTHIWITWVNHSFKQTWYFMKK